MTVHAHFDGKAIIPDEPLDIPPNQALILQDRTGGTARAGGGVGLGLARRECDRGRHAAHGSGRSARPLPLRKSCKGQAALVAAYFADTSFWMALSRQLDSSSAIKALQDDQVPQRRSVRNHDHGRPSFNTNSLSR